MANPAERSALHIRYGRQVLVLALFAVACAAALSIGAKLSAARIARNERAWFEAQINALVPHELFDNDLLQDRTLVLAPQALGTRNPVAVYRARLKGLPTCIDCHMPKTEFARMVRSAARAVGQACGANRIALIIPCHRVVGAQGALGGFMNAEDGDPIAIKRWLLRHEGYRFGA